MCVNVCHLYDMTGAECYDCCAYPNMKRSGEVVQIGLNEADVIQPEISAPTLGPDQRLLFVLYQDDLQENTSLNIEITI